MIETLIVIGIVSLVAGMAAGSLYRTLTGKDDGCRCTTACPGCTRKDYSQANQGPDVVT